jgi:hypothetical protein
MWGKKMRHLWLCSLLWQFTPFVQGFQDTHGHRPTILKVIAFVCVCFFLFFFFASVVGGCLPLLTCLTIIATVGLLEPDDRGQVGLLDAICSGHQKRLTTSLALARIDGL